MSKTRQWATLTAVVCLAVLAAGWFLVVKPQRSHAAGLRTQAQTVQASSTQLRSQVAQLRQQQKDLPAQQKLLSQIAAKVPDNPALPALIRQLSAAADGAGVNLVSLAPSAPTLVTATRSSAGTATTATATPGVHGGAPLAGIPLALQVQGSYFNIVQFFSAVESLNRAMLISGFSLSPATSGAAPVASTPGAAPAAGTLPPGTLNATINAQVFESPQLAPATTTAASTSATSTTGH